ncbi:MAG: hypothetical protein ABI321_13260 [Polyangia bacterium]
MYTKLVLTALTAFMMACGGGSGGTSGGESTFCVNSTGGEQTCNGYTNVDSAFKSAEDSSCKSVNGTVASSCPTSGLDGCCHVAANGVKSETCFYQNNAADEQSSCVSNGDTWTTTP